MPSSDPQIVLCATNELARADQPAGRLWAARWLRAEEAWLAVHPGRDTSLEVQRH